MSGWDFQASDTFGDPEWEFEQRRLIESAKVRGWILKNTPTIEPAPLGKRAPAVSVETKKSAVGPQKGKTAVLGKARG